MSSNKGNTQSRVVHGYEPAVVMAYNVRFTKMNSVDLGRYANVFDNRLVNAAFGIE